MPEVWETTIGLLKCAHRRQGIHTECSCVVGNRTCAILRAPWWDIVKGETPNLLQRKTVMVYDKAGTELVEKRNPMRKYCFKVRGALHALCRDILVLTLLLLAACHHPTRAVHGQL